jgi:hypothetical protein
VSRRLCHHRSGIKVAGGGVVEHKLPLAQPMMPRVLNRQLTNMPALPFRPYAHSGSSSFEH